MILPPYSGHDRGYSPRLAPATTMVSSSSSEFELGVVGAASGLSRRRLYLAFLSRRGYWSSVSSAAGGLWLVSLVCRVVVDV